jgi:hypothetical protein
MAKQLYDIRNYPRNAGTSQPARYNETLMGEHVAIIEQSFADYIVFAQKLSVYLKYYDDKDHPAGNWQNFLVNDVSYHLAVLVAEKSKYWEETWHELMERVEGVDDEAKNRKYFTWRFDFLYTLIGRLTDAFIFSKQLPAWQNDLQALFITSNLNIIYELLEKYHKASEDLVTADAGIYSYKDMVLNKQITIAASIETNKEILSSVLAVDGSLIKDGTIIFGDNTKVIDKINGANEYLDDLARQLLRLYTRVNEIAIIRLKDSLADFNEHQPHVGLFYAFLQLLEEHKTEINSLLLRHLDYYYKQVLNVKGKPYQPSQAYIAFEPAKNVNEYFIPAESKLAAGKDAGSKDIFYKTQQDIIVNKAGVEDVKSFTVIKNDNNVTNERIKAGDQMGLFASAQANSSDGNGKPLLPGQSWNAFRSSTLDANNDTQIGLSIYSSMILQAPDADNRYSVSIKFKTATGLNDLKNFVEAYSTIKVFTEKEPLLCTLSNIVYSNALLNIEFTIPAKTKIRKAAPHVSIVFGKKENNGITDNFFTILKTLQAAEIEKLSITLMNQRIPVSKAETVLGMTDLSASFPAFGGVPKNGSWFKIIEPILKGKAVSELKAEIQWASKTERSFGGNVEYAKEPNKTPVSVSYSIQQDQAFSTLNIVAMGTTPPVFSNDHFKVMLSSSDDLGHKTFAQDVAAYVSDDYKTTFPLFMMTTQHAYAYKAMAEEESSSQQKVEMKQVNEGEGIQKIKAIEYFETKSFPSPPYTPVIKSIDLICSLTETITNTGIFYQYPHGFKNVGSQQYFLIPKTEFEGELFIGFRDLSQAQGLNVLIQVEEGTADPTLPNPEVSWQFLYNNEWQNFDSAQFKDGTKGLIRSGILSFVSPEKNCLENTLLPAGQFWIRGGIKYNESNAICRIHSIHTQAVSAIFTNNDNDAAGLGENLQANTITQLFPKQASIKKVIQPYAGFGGRLEESSKDLYTRTSERLRHKNRAVNAWDYEHILTEAFPEIYKVKVLNHAHLKIQNDEKLIVSKAGDIILLVVGKTAAQSSLYKPLISKSKLTEITEYISQFNSAFATINVMNPLFEEISVDTIVTFTANIKDEAFYEKKLQTDIRRFLSPWAFETGIEPEFGGTIYRAALLDFIEELPYIDFVEKLEISHKNSVTGDMATASSPASVLISAATHTVNGNLASNNILSPVNISVIA